MVTKGAFSRVTAVFGVLLIIIGIGGVTIFSIPAFGDEIIGTPLPPVQSPGIDTTVVTDSSRAKSTGTVPVRTSTLPGEIALLIINLI